MDGIRQIRENVITNPFLIFLVTAFFSRSGLNKAIGHTALSNRLDRTLCHVMGSIFIPSPGSGWFSKASVICEQICPRLRRAEQVQGIVCSPGDIVTSQDRSPKLMAVKPGMWFTSHESEFPWHFMK